MQVSTANNRFNAGLLRSTIYNLYKERGVIRGLYLPGLVPSLIREMLNSGIRSGFYIPVRNYILVLTNTNSKESNNLFVKVLSAMSTGVLGSIVANPLSSPWGFISYFTDSPVDLVSMTSVEYFKSIIW